MDAGKIMHLQDISINAERDWHAHKDVYQTCNSQKDTACVYRHINNASHQHHANIYKVFVNQVRCFKPLERPCECNNF